MSEYRGVRDRVRTERETFFDTLYVELREPEPLLSLGLLRVLLSAFVCVGIDVRGAEVQVVHGRRTIVVVRGRIGELLVPCSPLPPGCRGWLTRTTVRS